jgi:hypothetical protein
LLGTQWSRTYDPSLILASNPGDRLSLVAGTERRSKRKKVFSYLSHFLAREKTGNFFLLESTEKNLKNQFAEKKALTGSCFQRKKRFCQPTLLKK